MSDQGFVSEAQQTRPLRASISRCCRCSLLERTRYERFYAPGSSEQGASSSSKRTDMESRRLSPPSPRLDISTRESRIELSASASSSLAAAAASASASASAAEAAARLAEDEGGWRLVRRAKRAARSSFLYACD